jgi:hypothetical protein
MAKVNMIDGAGNAFTTSLKQSRVHLANKTATLADAPKAPAKKVAAKKATKKVAKKAATKKAAGGYRTRDMKAK